MILGVAQRTFGTNGHNRQSGRNRCAGSDRNRHPIGIYKNMTSIASRHECDGLARNDTDIDRARPVAGHGGRLDPSNLRERRRNRRLIDVQERHAVLHTHRGLNQSGLCGPNASDLDMVKIKET